MTILRGKDTVWKSIIRFDVFDNLRNSFPWSSVMHMLALFPMMLDLEDKMEKKMNNVGYNSVSTSEAQENR
jgi:hypothetical protein